ncbi:hypothetical protein SAMN05192533_110118 [Mesobacillus persicus]|uniref:Uncharacterized protein n=1 Tax=Mesobacillus persicus TaxID=930146 RepID=A0A1H8EVH6_9BACI|nr:hypothetical protein SAMN05192533_110118 [Mesobacillus persicus]
MLKWVLIALIPIVLLLVIEELVQFFWKRYINGPREKKEGKLKDRLVSSYQNLRASIRESKWMNMFLKSKFVTFLKRYRKILRIRRGH